MTTPPSYVEPPPGYVHRRPCTLPWCPGDYRWTDVPRLPKRKRDASRPELLGLKGYEVESAPKKARKTEFPDGSTTRSDGKSKKWPRDGLV